MSNYVYKAIKTYPNTTNAEMKMHQIGSKNKMYKVLALELYYYEKQLMSESSEYQVYEPQDISISQIKTILEQVSRLQTVEYVKAQNEDARQRVTDEIIKTIKSLPDDMEIKIVDQQTKALMTFTITKEN